MRQQLLQEKYPVFVLELKKSETDLKSVDEIVDALTAEIEAAEKVALIGVFDHFAHTSGIGGEIDPKIKAAKNVVFCFGFALPNPLVLSVRPRSIGVADVGESFVLSFLEPPMEVATKAMERWCRSLAA